MQIQSGMKTAVKVEDRQRIKPMVMKKQKPMVMNLKNLIRIRMKMKM